MFSTIRKIFTAVSLVVCFQACALSTAPVDPCQDYADTVVSVCGEDALPADILYDACPAHLSDEDIAFCASCMSDQVFCPADDASLDSPEFQECVRVCRTQAD